jgi:hypothetical protein
MSYREKRALITLPAVWAVVAGYVFVARRAMPDSIAQALPDLIRAMALLVGILIVSHIVLLLRASDRDEARRPSDERDRLIGVVSSRNAGWIGIIGLWLLLMLAVMSASHIVIAQAALGAFVLAETVRYGSELLYYRRGL